MNYYNEHDPKAAAWLKELIAQGHIPAVKPHEIAHYTQQHFFAGIGGWPLALIIAGWSDSRPVRTGSCPCQPFSQAGKGKGEADERHLWPVFRDLITFGDPTVTFGEQVASKAGRAWLHGVRSDLEGLGYAVGAADLCAAGLNAPHIRQRLFWVAHPQSLGLSRRMARNGYQNKSGRRAAKADRSSDAGRLDYPQRNGRGKGRNHDGKHVGIIANPASATSGMVNTDSTGRKQGEFATTPTGHGSPPFTTGSFSGMVNPYSARQCQQRGAITIPAEQLGTELPGNAWNRYDILPCTDGKARRIESGTFPLAHGLPARVVRLRGYGNAIVPEVAAEFILAYLESLTSPV